MTKKFTQSIFILLLLNLLVKPFWIFAIDRNIQNRVGAEEYGFYFSLFSFSLLFNMISDLGITNYNNRFIAQNREQLKFQFGQILPIKIILGVFYCLITIFAGLFLDYKVHQLWILFLLTFNQVLVSFTLYLRSNISAIQLFNLDSLLSVIDKSLMTILCSILLWANFGYPFKIEWLVYTQTVSYFITFIVVLVIVLHKTGKPFLTLQLKTIIHILKAKFSICPFGYTDGHLYKD